MGRLFAISDIHGCYKPFYELVVNVIKLKKTDQLILLGDYIDRGEQSKEVIDFIIDLQKSRFNITILAGNHEVMLLDSYNNPEILPLWLMNSGMSTLISFNIQNIIEFETRYIEFFASLEYYKIIGKFVFVHAGFDDYAINPFSDKHDMIWECRNYYQHPELSGKIIVHGHRPKPVAYVKKLINDKSMVIPIDTGCVYEKVHGYGILSALSLHDMNLISVPNY
jgi:serine/threonine protein phosphatase 1